jgi:hypothetical protein
MAVSFFEKTPDRAIPLSGEIALSPRIKSAGPRNDNFKAFIATRGLVRREAVSSAFGLFAEDVALDRGGKAILVVR